MDADEANRLTVHIAKVWRTTSDEYAKEISVALKRSGFDYNASLEVIREVLIEDCRFFNLTSFFARMKSRIEKQRRFEKSPEQIKVLAEIEAAKKHRLALEPIKARFAVLHAAERRQLVQQELADAFAHLPAESKFAAEVKLRTLKNFGSGKQPGDRFFLWLEKKWGSETK